MASCMLSLYHSGLDGNPYESYDLAFCSNATAGAGGAPFTATECAAYSPLCEFRESGAAAQCSLKPTLIGTESQAFEALCDSMISDHFGCSQYYSTWCDSAPPAASTTVMCYPKYGLNAFKAFCNVGDNQTACEETFRQAYCEYGVEPEDDVADVRCRTINANFTSLCNMYWTDEASCRQFEASSTFEGEANLCEWKDGL